MLTIDDLIVSSGGIVSSLKRDLPLRGISIDTRSIQPGDCYVAIRGQNFDGHSFLKTAYDHKAAACVVDHAFMNSCSQYAKDEYHLICSFPNVIVVDDTVEALGSIARFLRSTFHGGCVGITGSCGKTTTKEFTARVLETKYSVHYTRGNLNNHLGLPLTLAGLDNTHSMLVSEMGASRPGDIAYLSDILQPEIGIITNIHPVHLESMGSLENVYKTKLELAEYLDHVNGTLIINGDDEYLVSQAKDYNVSLVTVGKKKNNDFMLTHTQCVDGTVVFVVNGRYRFVLNTVADYNVFNALAALAVADYYKIDIAQLESVFSACQDLSGRGAVIEGQIRIIDDSYNANPYSFSQVLARFARFRTRHKKIIVCGDMLELGRYSKRYHVELSQQIIASGVDMVIGVGKDIAYTIDTIKKNRPDIETFYYSNNEDALLFLRQEIDRGDVVLVKGSRGIKLDLIVDALSRLYCAKEELVS